MFERYQRSERALAEMYVQGVSTRKVKVITEELCGHSWRDFLLRLKARGLHGVEFVVADDHAGLRAALREALAEAAYQSR